MLGPSKYIFPRFGLNLTIAWKQIFGLGRPAGHRAAAAGAFKKADPLGPKRLGSRESIHAGQSVPAPHLVPSRSLDRRLVCPGPRSGCPQRVRVRPGLINRAFGRCIGQRPDPLDEGQLNAKDCEIIAKLGFPSTRLEKQPPWPSPIRDRQDDSFEQQEVSGRATKTKSQKRGYWRRRRK